MKKNSLATTGIAVLVVATLMLGADRVFVSANDGSIFNAMSAVTTVALALFLIGAILLFKAFQR